MNDDKNLIHGLIDNEDNNYARGKTIQIKLVNKRFKIQSVLRRWVDQLTLLSSIFLYTCITSSREEYSIENDGQWTPDPLPRPREIVYAVNKGTVNKRKSMVTSYNPCSYCVFWKHGDESYFVSIVHICSPLKWMSNGRLC